MYADALDRLAGRQYGLASLRQLRTIASDWRIDWWVRSARLIAIRRAVFRTAGAPLSWEQAVLAALMAAGVDAVASQETAARLHRLRGFFAQPDLIDITLPFPRWARLDGVRCHRTQFLGPRMVSHCGPIPVTSVARTIIDLSWHTNRFELARIVDDALRRGLLNLEDLRRCFEALPSKGRRKARAVRAILEDRLPGYGPGDSNAELEVFGWLGDAGFNNLRLGVRVEVDGKRFKCDIADPHAKIDLEFDDWHTHGTETAYYDDHDRDLILELDGWIVPRITKHVTRARVIAVAKNAYDRASRASACPDTHVRDLLGSGGA